MATDTDTELISLLKNSSIPINARLKGWEYILGLTASEDGLQHIVASEKYIPFLLSCIQQTKIEKEICLFSYKCLINISNHRQGAFTLLALKKDLIEHLFKSISSVEYDFIDIKCYIISNLSVQCEIAKEITDSLMSSNDFLNNIIKIFSSVDSNIRRKYDFLTLVLANISQQTDGRKFLLQKENVMYVIYACLNSSESHVRRLGAALTIRNCCLDAEMHEKLLKQLNVLPVILVPLMGSEEYTEEEMDELPIECQLLEDSKERDESLQVRRILVQTLCLLCYSETGWNYLKSKGAYFVLRELHKWEEDPTIVEAIETFVAYSLVENYSSPNVESKMLEPILIKEFEADISRDLPDFVI